MLKSLGLIGLLVLALTLGFYCHKNDQRKQGLHFYSEQVRATVTQLRRGNSVVGDPILIVTFSVEETGANGTVTSNVTTVYPQDSYEYVFITHTGQEVCLTFGSSLDTSSPRLMARPCRD